MPTTQQYILAKHDSDLISRLTAQAEMMKVPDPSNWVLTHLTELMQAPVGPSDTIVTVFAYAKEVRDAYVAATPPAPGANLGAVTDGHLETAITAVLNAPATP